MSGSPHAVLSGAYGFEGVDDATAFAGAWPAEAIEATEAIANAVNNPLTIAASFGVRFKWAVVRAFSPAAQAGLKACTTADLPCLPDPPQTPRDRIQRLTRASPD